MESSGKWRLWLAARLRMLPALLLSLAFLFYEELPIAIVTLSAILLHECGHLLAFSLLGEPPPAFGAAAGGFRLTASRPLSYRSELLISLAGPAANAAAALFALPLCLARIGGSYPPLVALIMVLTAAANLLPIGDLDGGRILSAFLAERLPLGSAERVSAAASVATVSLGLFVSLAFLAESGACFYSSLFFFFFLFTLP